MTMSAPGATAAYSLFGFHLMLVGTQPGHLPTDQLLRSQFILCLFDNGCGCACGFFWHIQF